MTVAQRLSRLINMQSTDNSTYIIGEIGQNHNGSVELAKKLIDIAALPIIDSTFAIELRPMDAIKLTKRDLTEELTDSEMQKPYNSPHAYGATYGEHRAALELSNEEHYELYQYAKEKDMQVVETICAIGALSLLEYFKPDRLKVASRDLTNLPLLEEMAKTNIPMILSTGMSGAAELDDALSVITKHHTNISILHCLSQYPAQYEHIQLRAIPTLKQRYPDYAIGYSDHSVGIVVPAAAVAMGAQLIEKHITISRSMKGSDHEGSLGPDGVQKLVRDIRHIEQSLGNGDIECQPVVTSSKEKLQRSIASRRQIQAGEIISEGDIHLLSPGTGLTWSQRAQIVGAKALVTIPKNELITTDQVKEASKTPEPAR